MPYWNSISAYCCTWPSNHRPCGDFIACNSSKVRSVGVTDKAISNLFDSRWEAFPPFNMPYNIVLTRLEFTSYSGDRLLSPFCCKWLSLQEYLLLHHLCPKTLPYWQRSSAWVLLLVLQNWIVWLMGSRLVSEKFLMGGLGPVLYHWDWLEQMPQFPWNWLTWTWGGRSEGLSLYECPCNSDGIDGGREDYSNSGCLRAMYIVQ